MSGNAIAIIQQALNDIGSQASAKNAGWTMDIKTDANDPRKYIVRLRRPEGSSGVATRVNQVLHQSKRTLRKVEIQADENGNLDLTQTHSILAHGFIGAFRSREFEKSRDKKSREAWEAEHAQGDGGPST